MNPHFILCDVSGMNFFEFKFAESYRATNKIGSVKYFQIVKKFALYNHHFTQSYYNVQKMNVRKSDSLLLWLV